MSRLTALHVPFVSGHNDAIDARVMPDGVFRTVQNGRLLKAGSLALRRGWRPLTMTEMATANEFVAHDLYSYGQSLVAIGTLGASANQRLATYVESSATRPWRAYTDAPVPPVTNVRAITSLPDMSMDAWSTAYALTSDGQYGLAMYQAADSGPADAVFRVFRVDTDQTVAFITDGSGIASVFSLGSMFGRVRLQGTNLVYSTLDPSETSPAFTTVATLLAGVTSDSPFAVAVARESAPSHLHTVVVDGGAATYRRFSASTGVISGVAKTVAASDVTQYPAVASDDVTVRVLTKADTGDVLSLLTFDATGAYTTIAGPTALFSSDPITASLFCIGIESDLSYIAAQYSDADDVLVEVYTSTHTLVESAAYRSSFLSSGWIFSTPYAGIGLARFTQQSDENAAFCYTDRTGPWLWSQYGTASISSNHGLTGTPSRVAAPAQADGKVLTGGYAYGTFVYPFTLLFDLGSTARRPGVAFGNTLYISGGVLTQWSGNDMVENGIPAPVIQTLTGTNGAGTMGLGTYSYRAVVTWFDERRGLHRSVVSSAVDVTLTGVQDTVEATVNVAATMRRNANVGSNPTVTLFRTEEGPGELFYRSAFAVADVTEDSVTLTDVLADASILTEPRLYTEGEFGAVSGVLDIAPPRASAYAAAMRDRIVLGSAGPAYQVSQTLLPEEPVAFAEPGVSGPVALSYFDSVEDDLTAVATLDDTIVLGTSDAVYVAGGEGPNLAGVGSFQSPARLPSDVGVYDWRSVIETSEGLWFLGAEGKLYLLPRGGGVPQYAGEAVQDRFTGTVVGCARETEDDTVAWAVAGASPVLVVHEVNGGWFSDPLPFTPVSLITHQGSMYAVADDGVVWAYGLAGVYGDGALGDTAAVLQADTGHIQVFSQTGQGRIGAIDVLGEFQNPSAVAVAISYDDGVTWTALGSFDITGTAGDTFERQFYPARQRNGRFRLRLTMTPDAAQTEGCRLTGFTVYYRTASGPTRLPSASRK